MTYTATVTVAQPLTALMSAETVEAAAPAAAHSRFAAALTQTQNTAQNNTAQDTVQDAASAQDGGATEKLATYAFRQRQPVPAYLLALAVGWLESRAVGPRSRIWAEPAVVEAAAWEFAETESFLAAGTPFRFVLSEIRKLAPKNLEYFSTTVPSCASLMVFIAQRPCTLPGVPHPVHRTIQNCSIYFPGFYPNNSRRARTVQRRSSRGCRTCGGSTTCWCCRPRSPTAAWRTHA